MNRQVTTVRQTLQTICSGVHAEQKKNLPHKKYRITPNAINPNACTNNTQRERVGALSFEFSLI